jgi:hypothetical protein
LKSIAIRGANRTFTGDCYGAHMWRTWIVSRPQADCLEAQLAGARLALACPYSCSDEYEAAVIAARREAGVYGGKRHQRHALIAAAAMLVLLLLVAAT